MDEEVTEREQGEQKKILGDFQDHLMSPLGSNRYTKAVQQLVTNCHKYLDFITKEEEAVASPEVILDRKYVQSYVNKVTKAGIGSSRVLQLPDAIVLAVKYMNYTVERDKEAEV